MEIREHPIVAAILAAILNNSNCSRMTKWHSSDLESAPSNYPESVIKRCMYSTSTSSPILTFYCRTTSFHADNCPGQNKNKTFLHYFLWRCCVGLNDDITFLFMEPGHTKCFCDSCFGMIKRVFRKSDVNTIQELERVVERSSKGNRPCHFSSPEEGHVFRDWATFLGDSLLPLKGISRFFKFRFTKTDPGDFTHTILEKQKP